jgi:Cu+-exporting ATPase
MTEIELSLGGMTCASCANRIERKLNKLDGVSASVNYATEKARVQAPADLDPAVLVAQVEAAGYTATLPAGPEIDAAVDPVRALRDRLVVSALLTGPVIAMAMAPALQFTYWQWISLTLAAPVAVWGAWPFHRAAWTNLRHGSTTMDTLVSMGVLAAFGWSVWALLFGTAGEPGMVHPFTFSFTRGDASGVILV